MVLPISDADDAITLEQIVSIVEHLDPLKAVRGGYIDHSRICTAVFKRILVDDEEIALNSPESKDAVGYVRVSTEGQKLDGLSLRDQVTRIVRFFAHPDRRWRFCIYSDATLSGMLPIDDQKLVEKIKNIKADMYEAVFENVFLSPIARKNTLDEEAGFRDYLKKHLAKIRRGLEDYEGKEDGGRVNRHATRKTLQYRPALTDMLRRLSDYHTLVITDITRISRSHAMTIELADYLKRRKANIIGLMERLDYMRGGDFVSGITLDFYGRMAEYKLQEVCKGSLLGTQQMLQEGKPMGSVPYFLERIPKTAKRPDAGRAIPRKGAWESVQTLVRTFLAENVKGPVGVKAICTKMVEMGVPCYAKSGEWLFDSVDKTLRNPALGGFHRAFGILWAIYPAPLEPEEYEALQTLLNGRRTGRVPKANAHYLLTGLFKCQCGANLQKVLNGKHWEWVCWRRCGGKMRERRHFSIKADELETFVNKLMSENAAVVVDSFRHTGEWAEIQARIGEMDSELREVRKRIREKTPDAHKIVQEKLAAIGFGPETAKYDEMVATMVASELDSLTRTQTALEDRITELKDALSLLTPEEVIIDLKQRTARWNEMTNSERNALLHKMFRVWQVGGEEGKEYITPISISGYPFHAIQTECVQWGKGWRRHLPKPKDWIDQIL